MAYSSYSWNSPFIARLVGYLMIVSKLTHCCKVSIGDTGMVGYRMLYNITDYSDYGIIGCAKDCRRITGCVSINYDRSRLTCGLNFVTESNHYAPVIDENFVFSKIEDWTEDCVGTLDVSCDQCFKAIQLSSGQNVCKDVGCVAAARYFEVRQAQCCKIAQTGCISSGHKLEEAIIGFQLSTYEEVAASKNTSQSSTVESSQNAVNGDFSDHASTSVEENPYWYVNLGRNYYIQMVRVHNRADCCGENFHNISIYVGSDLDNMALCDKFAGPGETDATYDVNCSSVLFGRYVKLQKAATGAIEITEVEVFSKENYCI